MAGPVTLRNAVDTWTNGASGATKKNYGAGAGLRLRTGGAGTQYSWLYFSLPFPRGAKILSAKLRVYNANTGVWSVTLTAQRAAAAWSAARLNDNNKPGVTGATSAVFVPAAQPAGAEILFDVTDIMQTVSSGGAWYGLRITGAGSSNKVLFAANSQYANKRPTLEVTWSDAPKAPSVLTPSGNRAVSTAYPILGCDYTDPSADSPMASMQAQTSPTANWSAPDWDSGEIPTTVPQIDLYGHRNKITNGTFEVDVVGWSPVAICTIARSTAQAKGGVASMALTSTGAGNMVARDVDYIPCEPGVSYQAWGYSRAATTVRNSGIDLVFLDAGSGILQTTTSPLVANSNANFNSFYTVTAVAPPGAVTAVLRPRNNGIVSAGEVHYWDSMALAESSIFNGIGSGSGTYWRTRVKDADGEWSAWSHTVNGQGAQFQVLSAGTVTINNPAIAPNDYVSDPTPPIDWTVSGATQKHYAVTITRRNSAGDVEKVWTTGKLTGATNVVTPPAGVIQDTTDLYRVTVAVWDTSDRETNGSNPAYISATRDFTYKYDATVTPVSALAAANHPTLPAARLAWTRATQPDEWAIVRNGKVIDQMQGSDLFVSGTSYQYDDLLSVGRETAVYSAIAIVNNKSSLSNPTVNYATVVDAPWIMRSDGSNAIKLLGRNSAPQWSMQYLQSQELHDVVGDYPPLVITQSLGGYSGHVEGLVIDDGIPGITANVQRNNARSMRKSPGTALVLKMANESMAVSAYNWNIEPVTFTGQIGYWVSFDYVQVVY